MRNQDVRNPYSIFVNLTLCVMGSAAWLGVHKPYHRAAINYPLYGQGDLSDENMFAREQINFKLWHALELLNMARISGHFLLEVHWDCLCGQLGWNWRRKTDFTFFWQRYQAGASKPISGPGSCGKMQPLALILYHGKVWYTGASQVTALQLSSLLYGMKTPMYLYMF